MNDMNIKDVLHASLRQDLAAFIEKCATTLSPTVPFSDNWHLHALAWHLERVRLGKIRRLIVNMPPRSLKSISASVAFPAFVLGHDPSRRIVCVSYANELAAKHSNDFRRIVGTSWYAAAFQKMRVSPTKNTEGEVATTRNGARLATSVGGTLTGRGGGLIIIDDPLKADDATSDSKRRSANEWFTSTLLSRQDDKRTGAIIIVMQRVHMDDLTGFVTAQSNDWTLLSLPAIAEVDERIRTGEARWYRRKAGYPLQKDREPLEVLEELRRQLGSDTFSAQYQQSPVPEGGAMIKKDWIRRYTTPPERKYGVQIIQSWDTASKAGGENDYSVCTTWHIEKGRYYLLDVLRGRWDYPTLRQHVIQHAEVHHPTKVLIEDAGSGTALIQELRSLGRAVTAVKPERDKVTRMSIQSAKFEGGLIFLPEKAPWLAAFEAELFSFPNGKHDDQIDSVSQALVKRSTYGMMDVI